MTHFPTTPRGTSAFLAPGRDSIITESIDALDGKPHCKRMTPIASPRGGPDSEYLSASRGSLRGQSSGAMSPREDMPMTAAAASTYVAPEAHEEKLTHMYMDGPQTVAVADSSWCNRFKVKDPRCRATRNAAAQMALDALAEWDAPTPTASEDNAGDNCNQIKYHNGSSEGEMDNSEAERDAASASADAASADHAGSSQPLSRECSVPVTPKVESPRPKAGEVIYQPPTDADGAFAEGGPHADTSVIYETEIPDDCMFLEACSAPPAFDGMSMRHFPPPVGDAAAASTSTTGVVMSESAALLSAVTPPAEADTDASKSPETKSPDSASSSRFAAPKPKEKKRGCC